MIKKLLSKIKQSAILLNKYTVIDGFKIELSKKHMLPIYQKNFCYYDRIISIIAQLSDTKKTNHWIVDIGANVGDTLFAMLKHSSANFLCIEPDDIFYSLLKKNISTLNEHYKKRIKHLNAFVVLDTSANVKLEKTLGTAHKVFSEESNSHNVPSLTLKEIIEHNDIDVKNIDLIKIDVDGFDWECLMSMEELLSTTSALLYWENQLDKGNQIQREGYEKLVHYLQQAEYQYFFCFDNFGNYLASGNAEFLLEINSYLTRMNEKKTARTFYYVDVLACKGKDIERIKLALQKFYM